MYCRIRGDQNRPYPGPSPHRSAMTRDVFLMTCNPLPLRTRSRVSRYTNLLFYQKPPILNPLFSRYVFALSHVMIACSLLKLSAPVVSKTLLDKTVCVVGLGYVGHPLAEAFSRHLRTIGYRRNQKAVDELDATPGNRIEAPTDPSIIRQADYSVKRWRYCRRIHVFLIADCSVIAPGEHPVAMPCNGVGLWGKSRDSTARATCTIGLYTFLSDIVV